MKSFQEWLVEAAKKKADAAVKIDPPEKGTREKASGAEMDPSEEDVRVKKDQVDPKPDALK